MLYLLKKKVRKSVEVVRDEAPLNGVGQDVVDEKNFVIHNSSITVVIHYTLIQYNIILFL